VDQTKFGSKCKSRAGNFEFLQKECRGEKNSCPREKTNEPNLAVSKSFGKKDTSGSQNKTQSSHNKKNKIHAVDTEVGRILTFRRNYVKKEKLFDISWQATICF